MIGLFAVDGIVRRRRGPTTRDVAGDQHGGAPTDAPLGGCSIIPGTSSEDTTDGFSQLDTTATLYGPNDLDLTPGDQVLWNGGTWTVQGAIARYADPLGLDVGSAVVQLRRREG